jgi:hypothetical protein
MAHSPPGGRRNHFATLVTRGAARNRAGAGWRWVRWTKENVPMTKRRLACFSLAASLAVTALPAAPALADGAASTRNIIIGGAAAALLIINHNKKVHEKYAEYDRRQAQTQAAANDAEAAYESERQAYQHEAALVSSYRHEVAIQHQEVLRLRHQLAMQGRAPARHVASRAQPAFHPLVASARSTGAQPQRIANANTSYGWGAL